jgi:hypothetical protein
MTSPAPRREPPINHALKIILAGVMMWAGLNLSALMPNEALRWAVSIGIGLIAMLLVMAGLKGLSQMNTDKANGQK